MTTEGFEKAKKIYPEINTLQKRIELIQANNCSLSIWLNGSTITIDEDLKKCIWSFLVEKLSAQKDLLVAEFEDLK